MSDIDAAVVVDSLKVLDPNRPIREADIGADIGMRREGPRRDMTPLRNKGNDMAGLNGAQACSATIKNLGQVANLNSRAASSCVSRR